MENELYKEPPDPVLDAVAKLVSLECREWIGSPSELTEAIQTEMASNALTKYLNVKGLDDSDGRDGENDTVKNTVAIVATVAERK